MQRAAVGNLLNFLCSWRYQQINITLKNTIYLILFLTSFIKKNRLLYNYLNEKRLTNPPLWEYIFRKVFVSTSKQSFWYIIISPQTYGCGLSKSQTRVLPSQDVEAICRSLWIEKSRPMTNSVCRLWVNFKGWIGSAVSQIHTFMSYDAEANIVC